MTALTRYTRPVDGTIPVQALLYDDEHLLASQDGVGLYDGPNKSPEHQSGTLHISSHRLFFIAGASSSSPLQAPLTDDERGASVVLPLNAVSHTESYTRFFKSSPKVTLHLHGASQDFEHEICSDPNILAPTPRVGAPLVGVNSKGPDISANGATSPSNLPSGSLESPFELWECEICGYRNPPGLSPAARAACGLCGMPRTASSSATPSSSTPRPASSSLALSSASESSASPVPVPITSLRNITTSGASHVFSKSLPSSNANTPAPLSVSPDVMTEEFPEDERRRRKRKPSALACSVCTFLNHPYLRDCEICGTPLPTIDTDPEPQSSSSLDHGIGPSHATSKSAPTSRPVSLMLDSRTLVDVDERERYIKLSFRKGGDKAFYAALKTALQQKAWEVRNASWKMTGQQSQVPSGLSGISGILQNINTTAQFTERGMSDAFSDLEALMSKAQDMVRLAKGLNEQLTAASRNSGSGGTEPLEPEEATFVRSSLGQLGLSMKNTAVTSDMSSDERKYLEQLAMELAGVLEGGSDRDTLRESQQEKVGIMRRRGIVGLDEVWGGWNRARGVALISPDITLKTLPFLPRYTTPPISTRVLASGLRVLHTPAYSTSAFSARLMAQLVDTGPCTTSAIAGTESLSVSLVEELVREVEEKGEVCREDPMTAINAGTSMGIEVKWWPNAFVAYTWDGQTD